MTIGSIRISRAARAAALAVLAVGFGLQVDAAGKAGGKTSDIPVTATVATSQNGVGLRVEGDFKGTYQTTSQVTSVILASSHDWVLQTYYYPRGINPVASDRSVFFDLTEPVSPGNPLPPFSTAYVQSHLIVRCGQVGIELLAIPTGTTAQCPGAFKFLAPNGNWYRLGFATANYPEVEHVNVTCNASDSRGCIRWSMAPSGTTLTGTDPNPKNVAKLLLMDSSGGTVVGDLGDYYVSFAITVSR